MGRNVKLVAGRQGVERLSSLAIRAYFDMHVRAYCVRSPREYRSFRVGATPMIPVNTRSKRIDIAVTRLIN